MKTKKDKNENPWVYIQNAKKILKEKAGKDGEFYEHPKYVRIAGHTAYMGVLIALDELMKKYNCTKKSRKKVEDYQEFLAIRNRKILTYFNETYEILHLVMGYDGSLLISISKEGFKLASHIIEWVEKQLGKKWDKENIN